MSTLVRVFLIRSFLLSALVFSVPGPIAIIVVTSDVDAVYNGHDGMLGLSVMM